MKVKKIIILGVAAIVSCLIALPAQATIYLGPGDADATSDISNMSYWNTDGNVEALVGSAIDLTMLYKAEVGGGEEGMFADWYETTFSNTATDPSDALIEPETIYPGISCPECYLLVKDGNHTPALYAFDLSTWDGIEAISLEGFWPNGGAISNISIWGGNQTPVPEPSTIVLLGSGLLGLAYFRRRKN